MAKAREVTIVVRAKNALARGLNSAHKQLQAFGRSALRIGGFFAKAFLAAGAALVGFAAKAVSAYAVQERAEMEVVAALKAQGQAGKALLPGLRKIASAIQDETGAADEATLAGMAKMKMLGVQTSKLKDAAKATIALKSIGLEEAAAQRYVALAMQGDYTMLQRYVPALRTATDETEKARIVNELFSAGYEQQKAALDTVSGRWGLLKARVGDLWEEVGKAIAQNDMLRDALARAGDAVKAFGQKVVDWIGGGGMTNLTSGVLNFANEASLRFGLVGNSIKTLWAALTDGAETAISYVLNVVTTWKTAMAAQFRYVGDLAKAMWQKIKHPTGKFEAPRTTEYEAALRDYWNALKGGEGAVTKRTEAALAEREAIEKRYADRTVAIAEWQAKALNKTDAKQNAMLAERQAKRIEDLEKWQDKENALLAERKEAVVAAATAAIAKMKEEIKTREDLAKKTIASYLQERRAAKEAAKEREQENAKARRLMKKTANPRIRMAREDREWLTEYNRRTAAAKEGEAMKGKLSRAEGVLAKLNEQRTLVSINDELKKHNAKLDALLRMG